MLGGTGLPAEKVSEIEDVVRPYFTERWVSQLQFFNFAENEAFLVSKFKTYVPMSAGPHLSHWHGSSLSGWAVGGLRRGGRPGHALDSRGPECLDRECLGDCDDPRASTRGLPCKLETLTDLDSEQACVYIEG